jgi:tetratricopeptide (TPR) repeat protein
MSSNVRARELEALFREALEHAPDERAAWLAQRCGQDQELRARVQALLEQDARGTHGILADPARLTHAADLRIGRYRLVRILGEGGMGTVHLAEQEEPVQRLVALKTIRPGAFSSDAAARFAAECQALAEMDHPGIAKIFDGGLTEDGRPYLVMEYVPGLPLLEYCDRHRLALRERLELGARVCDAVQHAHQKGVVHRDLKPGNVLVDLRGGRHEPRVIDFGLARALAGPLARGAAPQPLTDLIGTPAYMSPARLRGEGGVDTRDDVYALGVMLYELIAAAHPFGTASRAERMRTLDQDPPPPSVALAGLGAGLEEAAALRRTTARRLLGCVRGELDALVLRAVAREASRRYASSAALAEDLRRFLRHEPLAGVRTGGARRARKFLRRHGLAATFGFLLFSLLAAGLALQRAAWRRADEDRRAAEGARVEAEVARALALRLRDVERGEREESDLLVRAFMEALLLAQAGEDSDEPLTVAELLAVLASRVELLGTARPGAEAALRSALGRAYLVLGREELALEQYLRAHAIGSEALASDALDRFEVLEGLIEASRRNGDLAGARTFVVQALETARTVYTGRDERFLAALGTLLAVASGQPRDGDEARSALALVLASLPDAIVRGDESGVTARILIEASVQLVKQGSPQADGFLAELERCARALLAPEDLRRVTLLWTLMHVRLQEGAPIGAEAVRAGRELAHEAERRLAPGHWLRSDARRLLGRARLANGALGEAEAELLSALQEARLTPGSSPRRSELAVAELDELALRLAAVPDPERLGFVERSYALHGRFEDSTAGWWLAGRPNLPANVLETALSLLRTRTEPDALFLRAMLLTRAERFEEALETFRGAPGRPPTAAGALHIVALARSGRLAEARAELLRLAEPPEGGGAPEIAEWLPELRELVGL